MSRKIHLWGTIRNVISTILGVLVVPDVRRHLLRAAGGSDLAVLIGGFCHVAFGGQPERPSPQETHPRYPPPPLGLASKRMMRLYRGVLDDGPGLI